MRILKILALFIIIPCAIFCFAGSVKAMQNNIGVYIYPYFVWTADYDNIDSRSGAYDNVFCKLHSLVPTEGHNGEYNKIKVRVTNSCDLIISDTYNLDKNTVGFSVIPLTATGSGITNVGFEFRGNWWWDAEAFVSYSGR